MLLIFALSILVSCSSTIPIDKKDGSGMSAPEESRHFDASTRPADSQSTTDPQIGTDTDPAETEAETAAPVPVNKVDTTAVADTGNTVYTHTPRTDFFVGTASEDSRTTQVIRPTNVLQSEDFIFSFDLKYGIVKRNLKTYEKTPVCTDPYCSHKQGYNLSGKPEDACPFNSVFGIYFLYGNKIYYTRSYVVKTGSDGAAEWHDVFSSYDYVTGEYHAIDDIKIPYNTRQSNLTAPHEAYQFYGSFCLYGSYAYSFQYRPINGKGESAEDYGRVLVRLDLNTDKSEDLMPVDGLISESATIYAIRNKVIYLLASDGLWVWKPEEGSVRRITVIDPTYTKWYPNGEGALYNGYLYTMTYHYPEGTSGAMVMSIDNLPVACLIRINLNTGEAERLTDVTPLYVFMRDDTIWIVPQKGYMQQTEYWRLNVNPWKESTNPHKKYMTQILTVDMNGGNMQTIGYCNPDALGETDILLTEYGLVGEDGFFEFSTGITFKKSGEIYDDPQNGYIAEPEYKGGEIDYDLPNKWTSGEETWW